MSADYNPRTQGRPSSIAGTTQSSGTRRARPTIENYPWFLGFQRDNQGWVTNLGIHCTSDGGFLDPICAGKRDYFGLDKKNLKSNSTMLIKLLRRANHGATWVKDQGTHLWFSWLHWSRVFWVSNRLAHSVGKSKVFNSSREPLKPLAAPSKSLDGSPTRSTFKTLVEA